MKIKKIKSKSGLKNKQSEKIDKNAKTDVLAPIPPLKITSFEAIRHFEQFGGISEETPQNGVSDDQNPKNFKGAGQEIQLKSNCSIIWGKGKNGNNKTKEDFIYIYTQTI